MRGAIRSRFAGILMVLATAITADSAAQARPATSACGPGVPLAEPIARASARFAISEALIHAVIAVESNYAVTAVSPKGAMGLMQLMPGTWAELRLRYALGADPFDPCDNILAGTAYLRELLDRYGDPGFLAAYSAGPGRYEAWLSQARPLPGETIAYVAKLSARRIGGAPAPVRAVPDPDAWKRGELFARASAADTEEPAGGRNASSPDLPDARPSQPRPDSVFMPRNGVPQ